MYLILTQAGDVLPKKVVLSSAIHKFLIILFAFGLPISSLYHEFRPIARRYSNRKLDNAPKAFDCVKNILS